MLIKGRADQLYICYVVTLENAKNRFTYVYLLVETVVDRACGDTISLLDCLSLNLRIVTSPTK